MRLTDKGREALFFEGASEAAIHDRLRQAFPSGVSRPPRFELGPLTLHFMGNERDGALVFIGADEGHQTALREVIARVADPPETLEQVVARAAEARRGGWSAPIGYDVLVRMFSLGGGDHAIVKVVGRMPVGIQRKVVIFMAGMLGQDVVDRVRSYLDERPVRAADLPQNVQHMLHRYVRHPEHLARVLYALAEMVPPLDNVALHLGMR